MEKTPGNIDVVSRYLETYLTPAPVQGPEESETDSQLSSLIMSILTHINELGPKGVLIDIGCGKGTLLQRLLAEDFRQKSDWIYVAVDVDENLDIIQRIARQEKIARRVEPINLDSFYEEWPQIGSPQLVFCRNVFHELNISQTAQLLAHLTNNFGSRDIFICQDLMNFPQGERHNVCWFPDELKNVLIEHEFEIIVSTCPKSKSGAQWFNMVARRTIEVSQSLDDFDNWRKSILLARQNQWHVWSKIDRERVHDKPDWAKIISTLDIDLQLASLTRQLMDAGTFISLSDDLEKRVRNKEIHQKISLFIATNQLEKPSLTEKIRLRERGDKLTKLEEFLRNDSTLALITGGKGSGKTCLAEHLLATRSYDKSVVMIDAKRSNDLWSLVESFLAQLGLHLNAEKLSVIGKLDWSSIDVPIRQFINHFSSRIILFIDNFDALLDTNYTIQDKEVSKFLTILFKSKELKVICALKRSDLPSEIISSNPLIITLGRFASEETVGNVLDDYFDRASAKIDCYPPSLIEAIDRHPLAAMLAGQILQQHGSQVLMDDRFLKELKLRLYRELWERLVDEHSIAAVEMANELRIPVPKAMLEGLSNSSAVSAGLDSNSLYTIKDKRWDPLVSILALFRRRHITDSENETEEREKHKKIADKYLTIYQQDDDPKWIRESYFHRMLATNDENIAQQLGKYYSKELINSANYCFFTKRDYREALKLYQAASKISELNEDARMHYASCLIRTDNNQGENEFEVLIRNYPANIGMKTSFVDAMLFVQDFTKAKKKLEEHDLYPDKNDWITGQWGRVWLGLSEYAKAEEMFKKQLNSSDLPVPEVFINLSRALQFQGAVPEALRILQRGKNLHPNDFAIIAALGGCLERLRTRDQEALELLKPLFYSRPDRTHVAIPIIKILSRQNGGVAEARRIFEHAKQYVSSNSESFLIFAEAELLKNEGFHEKAIKLLQEQPKTDPHFLGMLLECSFYLAQSKTERSERLSIAQNALNEPIPDNLSRNIPLLINRCRLAALADDQELFTDILEKINNGRVEQAEIINLEILWKSTHPDNH